MSNNNQSKKNILVVGDWVVDENWIVTPEISVTSSHIGKQQYRSDIKNVDSQLLSLCGAGDVARLLHSTDPGSDIYGLGYWEPRDTKYLAALFRKDNEILNQTPHTLAGMTDNSIKKETNPLCRQSSKGCIECKDSCRRLFSLAKDNSGTYKVLRVYSQSESQSPKLLFRFDFSPIEEKPADIISEQVKKEIKKELSNNLFDIVVVVDHNKGSVTPSIINSLKESKLLKRNVRWYIRTKNTDKKGINDLIDKIKDNVKLIVTGPMLLDLPSDSWFVGQHLSIGSLEWLCERSGYDLIPNKNSGIYNYYKKRKKNFEKAGISIVAFHNDNSLAALIPSHEKILLKKSLETNSLTEL